MIKHFFFIITALIIVYIILSYNNLTSEHYENLEAKNNISSLYNEQTLFVTDINVSGSFNMLPSGSIVMWTRADIPTGWTVCDGQNKTPDLRDRFVVGTVQSADNRQPVGEKYPDEFYKIGSQGGEETHLLTEKELPEHSHRHSVLQGRNYLKNVAVLLGNTLNGINGGIYDANSITQSDGILGIPGFTKTPHNNMPPYYALYYIMKL